MQNSRLKYAPVGVLFVAHFINDLYSNFLPQLVAIMIAAQSLSVESGTVLVAAFTVSSSFLQPLFGYLVDQKGQRWLVFVGTLWTSLLLGLTGYIAYYPLLLGVTALAGMGTAAFHPQAAALVGQSSAKRKGLMMSSFIAMGNMGLAFSPLVLLPLFHNYGVNYTWVAIVPGIIAALLLYGFIPRTVNVQGKGQGLKPVLSQFRKASAELVKLMLVVSIRSLVHTGLMTLLPVYFLSLKFSPEHTGYLMFSTLAAGSIGGVIGGYISDRYGNKPLIVSSLIASSVFFFGFFLTQGFLSMVLLGIGVMALLASFSVTVVVAQEIIPENKALASGLSLGFAIGIGGLAMSLIGKYAGHFGIESAIHLIFLMPLLAGILGLSLKGKSKLTDGRATSSSESV